MHCTDKYSQHSSIIWPVRPNGWVFVYELSGCGFESSCNLIYTLLRSNKHPLEDNYMKYINNNTDDEIKAKINNIRIEATRLGNILTKEERNNIREKLHKIEKKEKTFKSTKRKNICIPHWINAYLI